MVDIDSVLARVDAERIAELALQLANIDSPTGEEAEVAAFIGEWLAEHGFKPRTVGLLPERPNVMAVMKGSGGGSSLLFNSHMDTAVWSGDPRVVRSDDAIFHSGRREGDVLHGHGVMNDKGPMAAWMVAVATMKEAGVQLRGDVVMTMVSGEIGNEPVDEFQGLRYSGKDLGARYLAVHGGVADYALVAEATGFNVGWVEAGKVFCRVDLIHEGSLYTPFVPADGGPNAIFMAGKVLAAWESWAHAYTARHRYESPGGIVAPAANIGAVRGGLPWAITRTPERCSLYLDLRTSPGQSPTATVDEVHELLEAAGVEGEVELFLHRPGHEAQGVEPLAEAIGAAHRRVFDDGPGLPREPTTSMWRDTNVWNELGVPAAMYGPGAGSGGGGVSVGVGDLHKAALVYAGTAMELCA
ncbi:MAG TPA: M20/M25/M40 family metallo-hydrolase [Conexibacter sp.]|jgi:acetylornithine deacetylase/succinyl-diaminopimelate desuccinylase-like protein